MIQGIIHIHQGGTIRTYCGIRLNGHYTFVAWEDAAASTCPGCSAHFPQPCCPGAARGRCKVGCS